MVNKAKWNRKQVKDRFNNLGFSFISNREQNATEIYFEKSKINKCCLINKTYLIIYGEIETKIPIYSIDFLKIKKTPEYLILKCFLLKGQYIELDLFFYSGGQNEN